MGTYKNEPFPTRPFVLLLVEGGDERVVCQEVAESTVWANIHCWDSKGRQNLPYLAEAAKRAPNFEFARSVGVIMDVEESLAESQELAARTLATFGGVGIPVHGQMSVGPPRFGVFVMPDGASAGSIETLCRQAMKDQKLATCVDALLACAGFPHQNQALTAKGWLQAYLAMLPKPRRFHEAFTCSAVDPSHTCFDELRRFLSAL